MKNLFYLSVLFFSFTSFSQSKSDVSQMLGQLEKSGTFTKEQVKAAREQLEKMSDSDYKKMQNSARKRLNDPKILEKVKSIQKK